MLRRCPFCRYDLTGLPAIHTCPECGLAYDPDTSVIILNPRARDYRQFVYGGLLLALGFWTYRRGDCSGQDIGIMAVIVAAGLLAASIRLARQQIVPRVVILNTHGVRFGYPGPDYEFVSWPSFSLAQTGLLTGTLTLVESGGKTVFLREKRWFGGWSAARKCASEINRMARKYRDDT